MNLRLSCAVTFITGFLSTSSLVLAYQCLDGQFTPQANAGNIDRTLAQVLKTDTTGSLTKDHYLGTAFVIDSQHKLLLTATHVVERANASDNLPLNETVHLRFPGINGGRDVIPATVIHIFEPPPGRKGQRPKPGSHVEDVALLRLAAPNNDIPLQQLRLHMSQWSPRHTRNVTIHSFFDASNDVIKTEGTLTRASDPTDVKANLKCMLNVTASTDSGDSGAPVLSDDGFVVGVVLQARPRGQTKHARAMPSYCIAERLPLPLQQVGKQHAVSLAATLHRGTVEEAFELLKPSNDARKEQSNPIIHQAFTELGGMLKQSGSVDAAFLEKLECPINRAALERHIGIPERLKFATVIQFAKSNLRVRELGDEYLTNALQLKSRRDHVGAAAAAEVSQVLYAAEALRVLRGATTMASVLRGTERRLALQLSNINEQVVFAQTLKGYVDSVQLTREMLSRLDHTQEPGRADVSQTAAALAVALTQGTNRKLYAQSWAAFGKEAFDLKDYRGAVKAYDAALEAGAKQGWIKDSRDLASKLQDQMAGGGGGKTTIDSLRDLYVRRPPAGPGSVGKAKRSLKNKRQAETILNKRLPMVTKKLFRNF